MRTKWCELNTSEYIIQNLTHLLYVIKFCIFYTIDLNFFFQILDVPRSKVKPAWIFFDTNMSLLELFRNIHIWFDWEVIFANDTTTNQIDLFEVYHVAEKKPLNVDYFATWTKDQGLQLHRVSLVQRRNNLQGQVINGGSIHYPVSLFINFLILKTFYTLIHV